MLNNRLVTAPRTSKYLPGFSFYIKPANIFRLVMEPFQLKCTKAVIWLGLLGLCIIILVALTKTLIWLDYNDFGKLYYSSRYFLAQQNMYQRSPATQLPVTDGTIVMFANLNPPHTHLLLLPLSMLRIGNAYLLWSLLSIIALLASIFIAIKELGSQLNGKMIAWGSLFLLGNTAMTSTVFTGHLTLIMLLPLTLAWRDARNGHWNRTAIWWGVCAGIKPFLLIYVAWLLMSRKLRPALIFGSVIIASFALSWLLFGWQQHQQWLVGLSKVSWDWAGMNTSIMGFFSRSLQANPDFKPVFEFPALARWFWLLGSSAILWLTYNKLRISQSVDTTICLLTLCALLVSPLGWTYYWWWLAPPLLMIWSKAGWPNKYLWLYCMPTFMMHIPISHAWVTVTIGSLYMWLTLGLWIAVIIQKPPRNTVDNQQLAFS